MLFVDQLPNFAHLLTPETQTKAQFLQAAAQQKNPQTTLFVQAGLRSTFDTIRLSEDKNSVLFNQ